MDGGIFNFKNFYEERVLKQTISSNFFQFQYVNCINDKNMVYFNILFFLKEFAFYVILI